MFDANPRVGFLALANKYKASLTEGTVLAPAKSLEQMSSLVFNNQLNAGLTLLFMFVMLSVVVFGLRTAFKARANPMPTANEIPYQAMPKTAGQA